ncbi:TRAP transporter substrate-binding protein DctP [Mesobacillus harenae]|uniref:TRAP transporter substrate-binding protein DctP n=1 Tax=Mesobacillus harenae TaxID=2213203 RepID=UPI001F54C473|nr:TRAP transporter substrate-binding protein DctP [Mesobacillus harenae]
MKLKYAWSLLICLMLLLVTACNGQTEDTSGKPEDDKGATESFNFRVTSALSPKHGLWVGFYEPWMEQVEKETEGRVTFETFTSGELVEATNEMEALKQGTVDIAAPLLPIYDPASFPLSEVSMLPLASSSPVIGSMAFKKLLESDKKIHDGKTFTELEYGEHGIKVLPATISEQYSMSTTGLKFESVADVQKAQLRTPSRIHELFAKNVGISSVTMPTFDLFDAMSRGAVDGSFLFISDWTAYGFEELFKYTVTDTNLGHFSSLLAMTEEQWDEIPEDIQLIMIEAANVHVKAGAEIWVDRSEEIIQETSSNGAEFVDINDLKPEVEELLVKGMEKTWYDFIDILEEQGEPGTEIAKLWRDIIIEEGGDVPEAIKNLE